MSAAYTLSAFLRALVTLKGARAFSLLVMCNVNWWWIVGFERHDCLECNYISHIEYLSLDRCLLSGSLNAENRSRWMHKVREGTKRFYPKVDTYLTEIAAVSRLLVVLIFKYLLHTTLLKRR